MVVVSSAVTTTVIVFDPTESETAADALADATVVPFTVTVAFASVTVGVTVVDVMALTTLDVYDVVPELKDGLREPAARTRFESVAMVAPAPRVIVTVYVRVDASWAVTTTVTVFVPTASGRDEDAEPDATVVPFTVTVELG